LARQVLMIDTIASRYHCLPSEVIESADTFDLYIVNTALDLHAKAREQEEKKNRKGPPPAPKLTEDQMKAMLASVEEKQNGTNKEHNHIQSS